MSTIGKTEIINELKKRHDASMQPLSQSKASRIVTDIFEIIKDHTQNVGDKVTILGFGTFERRATNERMGKNPQTGKPIKIAAGSRLAFKGSKCLKTTNDETMAAVEE